MQKKHTIRSIGGMNNEKERQFQLKTQAKTKSQFDIEHGVLLLLLL